MRLHRVFPHVEGAAPGTSGHATYVYPRQVAGRWDNAEEYLLVYAAAAPEAAVAETFGRIPLWSSHMFDVPYVRGARSALATFELDDSHEVVDLDHARNLLERDLRPTQVVIRDLAFTQPLALRLYREAHPDGARRWAGIRWWSFWAPQWPVYAIWIPSGGSSPLQLINVQRLDVDSAAVQAAAATIVREFI